jgi:hypothetical protein
VSNQSDAILRDLLGRDIKRLEEMDKASPCSECGMLTLLKCKQAELNGSSWKRKIVPFSKDTSIIAAIIYAVLKAHGILP